MNLLDVVRPESVEAGAELDGKDAVLGRVAELACRCGSLGVTDVDMLRKALAEREELGSTGFGDGIAIPHCRLREAEDFVVGLLTVAEGVEFDALDEKPVRLFVFIVAPERESNEHIRILSAISQVLRIPGAVDELLAETSDQALYESFVRHQRDEVETKDHQSKNLFHVCVQDEERFRDILEIFAATCVGTPLVVEPKEAGEYLSRAPLFAGFWSDESQQFNRIITAVVEKRMTNETIRRVEQITGSLDECDSVMLSVIDIFYSSGNLRV